MFESLCLPNRVTIQTLQLPLLLDTRNEPRSKNICFWTPAAGYAAQITLSNNSRHKPHDRIASLVINYWDRIAASSHRLLSISLLIHDNAAPPSVENWEILPFSEPIKVSNMRKKILLIPLNMLCKKTFCPICFPICFLFTIFLRSCQVFSNVREKKGLPKTIAKHTCTLKHLHLHLHTYTLTRIHTYTLLTILHTSTHSHLHT